MELQVGQARRFTSTGDTRYVIREILENPGINLWWTWSTGVCPHCKQKLDRTINHTFYRIEILGVENKEDKDLVEDDIVLYGQTLDNRGMILPID